MTRRLFVAVFACLILSVSAPAQESKPAKVMTPQELVQSVQLGIVRIEAFGLAEKKVIKDGKSVTVEVVEAAGGTGFVVEGGFIVTNDHVLRPESKDTRFKKLLRVQGVFALDYRDPDDRLPASFQILHFPGEERTPDPDEITKNTVPLVVVNQDEKTDLAVLRVGVLPGKSGTPANRERFIRELASHALRFAPAGSYKLGEEVVAIGFARSQEGAPSVTRGIVSGVDRGYPLGVGLYTDLIQTDGALLPGNSGGPLFNLRGEVVGVNTYSLFQHSPGISYARSSRTVAPLVRMLQKSTRVNRPNPAFGGLFLNRHEAETLAVPQGFLVTEVTPGGLAHRCGLRKGDLITALAGQRVTRPGDLDTALALLGSDGTASITVWRLPEAEVEAVAEEKLTRSLVGPSYEERGITTVTLTLKTK